MHYQDDKPLYQTPDSAEGFKFGLWGIAIIGCIGGGIVLLLLAIIS